MQVVRCGDFYTPYTFTRTPYTFTRTPYTFTNPSVLLKIQKEEFVRLVKLGVPMAIKSAAIMFSKLFVNAYINAYGVAVAGFAFAGLLVG